MSIFDKDLFEAGLAKRKSTLGDDNSNHTKK